MKNILLLSCGATLVLATGSTVQAEPADRTEIIAAIKANEAQWNADIAARDPVKFASHYMDDATVMNPFAPPIRGRAAVEASMRDTFADPNFSLKFSAEQIGIGPGGRIAWTQGHCVETESNPATHARVVNSCSYLTVYMLQGDGSWKAVEDIASPSAPPQ